MCQFLSAYFLHPQQTKGKIQKVMLQCFCVVYHISLAKQTAAIKSTLMKLEGGLTDSAREATTPFLSFLCFQSRGRRCDSFKVKQTQQAAQTKTILCFVQTYVSTQTGCSASGSPWPSTGPCQKTFSLLGLSALLTGSFPLPLPHPPSVFLHPSFSWGGRAEGAQSIQMLMFHSESCTHIRLWLWFCSPIAAAAC